MVIGIPKEIKADEYRAACVPSGVKALREQGNRVLVEKGAGLGSGVGDREFEEAGAELVSRREVWSADMVVKVKEPIAEEYDFFRPGLLLFAYLHLAAEPELTRRLLESRVTAVAYETIQAADRSLPLLTPMSEAAGRMAVQAGARFLEIPSGGRGVLLGGVPGVRRGRVAVIGGGVVGAAALKVAVGMGADATILDVRPERLAYLDDIYGARVTTLISHADNIARATAESHLVIGAVLIPGARAPRLVTEDMVKAMMPGSVIVDVSIDQGGCVETMRPTTHADPVFVRHGVIHYGVTNMPGAVGRTSTFALTNATLPYILKLARRGAAAARGDPALAWGFNLHQGRVMHPMVAEALGARPHPLEELWA